MDIIIGKAPVVKKDPEKNPSYEKAKRKERRKNRQDRRKSVRSGVIVSLSTPTERRSQSERRKR
ncbi:MAG: hypothetical protein KKA54_09520 [Proteobacteria bacterium]|nr:hypothetical protein [Pseudomonadota bacterium]MBU0966606.1 hypothetical protein [Pseudomonadota bacterium]